MPVFVAYNYEGTPIDVVVGRSLELARTYWQGKGIIPHSEREISAKDFEDHPTGIIPIVSTREVEGYEISRRSGEKKYLMVKKP